jgi:crossover junction endodeoxyribonuclease RuvC
MRILGVDPGTLVVGFGCLDVQGLGGQAFPDISAVSTPVVPAPQSVPLAHRVSNLARVARTSLIVVAAGALRLGRSSDPVEGRLRRLADEIRRLVDELQPDELAIEQAFFGKSVQSALRLGESRGVILAEAARADVAVSQFPPARVKRSVTGSGAASKELVASMVARTLRLDRPPETADVTDALAVGLCCAEEKRSFRP